MEKRAHGGNRLFPRAELAPVTLAVGGVLRSMRLRLALVTVVVPLVAAACGSGGGPKQLLVYEKPATFEGWGWIWSAGPDGSHPHKLLLGYEPSVSPNRR